MTSRVSHTCDMTTNDHMTTEQLPDLPGLESAEAGASVTTWVIGFYVAFTLFMSAPLVYLYWYARPFFGDQLAIATVLIALIALLILWVILRLLSGVFHWKADAQGLTMRGPLRRWFIAWQDMEDAVSAEGTGNLGYRLRVNGSLVHVNVEGGSGSPAVYASIWQHLRRLGRAGDLQLPEAALTFWDRIPDELPKTMEWMNPRPPKMWVTILPILLLVVFLVWAGIAILQGGNWYMKGMVSIAGIGFLAMMCSALHDAARTAGSISITDDRIEARAARGTVVLPWSEIRNAQWAQNTNSGISELLVSGRSRPDRIAIPHRTSDGESGRLVLAIIRRLRTAGVPQALTIPEELRAQAGPARLGSQAVDSIALLSEPAEVRLTLRERLLIMMLPGFVAIAFMIGNGPEGTRSPTVSVPIALGILIAAWLASGTYAVIADSDGIRKRFMGFGTLVRWDDIAEYSICPVFKRAVKNHRVLKNSNGKVLTELSLGFGPREARDRFWGVLDAKLSQSWVSTRPEEPWKARPWIPE